MGKAQHFGCLAELLEAGNSSLLSGNQAVDLLAKPCLNGIVRPGDVLVTFLVGDDVDQYQTCRRRLVPVGEHEGIEGGLAFESLEALLGVEIVEIHGKMHGFDLIDPNRPVVLKNHSVGASRDLYCPAVNIKLEVSRHFARETGFGDLEVALDSAVKLGADPQAG